MAFSEFTLSNMGYWVVCCGVNVNVQGWPQREKMGHFRAVVYIST